jgi:hypothetical protein
MRGKRDDEDRSLLDAVSIVIGLSRPSSQLAVVAVFVAFAVDDSVATIDVASTAAIVELYSF